MRKTVYSLEALIHHFHRERVLTIGQMKKALGTEVKMTVFRKLKTLNYKASYSHTGRYYTLDEIAEFDKHGLWQFNEIYFSKFGTLQNTIENLVGSSTSGYTALELEQLLKVRVYKAVFELYKKGILVREQINKTYLYCYPKDKDLQLNKRKMSIESSANEIIYNQTLNINDPTIKKSLEVFLSSLNEKQRRLFVGFESMKIGYGGDSIMAQITGINIKTISKGRKELLTKKITPDRIRKSGGGRHSIKKKTDVIKLIEELMEDSTAGDPMSTKKWTKKSTYEISEAIRNKKIQISANTVGDILKDLDYSLKSNKKMIGETQHPDRNQQFEIINQMKNRFKNLNYPIISVDSKKKEHVGNFKNPGQRWCRQEDLVYTHDFKTYADGTANPYGIYELITNYGTVVIGTSFDTAHFSVESIELWLKHFGLAIYPDFSQLLILCDSGGSNGYRVRAWKYNIYKLICQKYRINVTVCHYPSGASKWNPVEHRLFSFITKKWAGVPLNSYDTILEHISETKTKQGLKVNAIMNDKNYEKGIKITDKQMKEIKIQHNEILPKWNYTIFK